MDYQALFNLAIAFIGVIGAILLAIVAFLLVRALDDLKAVEISLAEFKTHVASVFVTKTDFNEALSEIKSLVQKIFYELKDKADRA